MFYLSNFIFDVFKSFERFCVDTVVGRW